MVIIGSVDNSLVSFIGDLVTIYICRFRHLKKWNLHQRLLKPTDHFGMRVLCMYMII